MNILHIAGGLPTSEQPHYQPFIQSQINSLIKKGLNIEVLDLKGYKSPKNYFNKKKLIRRIVAEKKVQLIHAHYAYCGLSALMAQTKLPIILSLMGSDLLGSPNSLGKITFRGYFDKYLTNIISHFVDHIIVKSNRMKNFIKNNVPIDVIPNGVDFEIFKPLNNLDIRDQLGLNKNKFLILFLGNPNLYRKNFNLVKIVYEKLFSDYKLDNIKLLNPYGSPHKEIPKYMNASNVLLVTSFWEGSPNVVKEAMACNLPIISTDVGDVKEIISGTKNCFITPYDANVIAEKIKIIYKNRERSNGRERIQHLRDDKIAEKIINIYLKHITKN